MKKKLAKKILNDNKKTWNSIASNFNSTRQYIWPEIKGLVNYAKPGMKVLDLGCGNGRLFELLKDKDLDYTGIDNSEELINIAQEKYPQVNFLIADAFNLPFKDNFFDLVYSVAVLHIIPSHNLRLEFLREARRTLKKDGEIILTVWNLWQRKYLPLIVKHSLLKLISKSKLDWKDTYIPWRNKYQRYHHAFTKKALEKLFKEAGFNIKEIKYLKRNSRKVNILIVASRI